MTKKNYLPLVQIDEQVKIFQYQTKLVYDDVIIWNIFALLAFVLGIHRSPVNSPHKGQWRGALMFSLICALNNNREAGDLRRHRAHYHVIVMKCERIPQRLLQVR